MPYLKNDKIYFCSQAEGDEKQDDGTSPQEIGKYYESHVEDPHVLQIYGKNTALQV